MLLLGCNLCQASNYILNVRYSELQLPKNNHVHHYPVLNVIQRITVLNVAACILMPLMKDDQLDCDQQIEAST